VELDGNGDGQEMMDQEIQLEKRRKRKTKWIQGKGISGRSHFVSVIKTL
jgi:hypothetical protein